MRGAISTLPLYAFMAWCSVKKSAGTNLPLPFTSYLTYAEMMIKEMKMKRDKLVQDEE
jgi:hypothetical protein